MEMTTYALLQSHPYKSIMVEMIQQISTSLKCFERLFNLPAFLTSHSFSKIIVIEDVLIMKCAIK